MKFFLILLMSMLCLNSFATQTKIEKAVKVLLVTNIGEVEIELNSKKAPETVKNFLSYVDKKFYKDLIFHRVIKDFMVQGGGFTSKLEKKTTAKPVKNEANNGLTNDVGTVAMARTNDPNSATSQFFINIKQNNFLNYQNPARMGYTVFGMVTKGMPILKKMELTKTTVKLGHKNLPIDPIIIQSITRIK